MPNIDIHHLIANLPLTPSVLDKDEYFNAVVLIPLIKLEGEYHIVFEKRAINIKQGGEISFPGGGADDGEPRKNTAIRETVEELGIERSNIVIHGRMDTQVGSSRITIDAFLGELMIDSLEELDINKDEVEEVFSIPISYFVDNPAQVYAVMTQTFPIIIDEDGNEEILLPSKELGFPEKYHRAWSGGKHPVYVYPTEYGAIWGITARFIRDLVSRL